jgi:hypothetical protein
VYPVKFRLIVLPAILTVIVFSTLARAQRPQFTVCKSTYALCTTAKCTTIPGKSDVSCACDVKTGYSLGAHPCEDIQQTSEGQTIKSRYYPVKSYARCSNDRSWAYCLDAPCVIDKNDKSKAACTCSLVQKQGDYVITGDTYTKSTCTTGIISSATVMQLDQATDFLETQDALPPFDFKVLNVQRK